MGRKQLDKNRITTSIKVNPEIWKQIKSLAALRGIDLSELVEQLIKKELEKEGKK